MITLDIIRTQKEITVSSRFWNVVFDISKGGCIGDINFQNGSGRNILAGPLFTRVDEYFDVNDSSVTYSIFKTDKQAALDFKGELKDREGKSSGIQFTHRYIMREEYVKVETVLNFKQDTDVKEIEVGSVCLEDRLNNHVCRPPAESDCSWMNFSASHTVEINKPGEELSKYNYIPYNYYFYDKYVEGIDFEPDSEIYRWDNNFSKEGGEGLYLVKKQDNCIYLKRSPLTVEKPRKIFKGAYSLGYYLGLPKIYDKVPRKWHFVSTRMFPKDEVLKGWAESGINLLKLHNDCSKDGVHWRNGCYPPYDPRNMEEMRRVIGTAHSLGMKVMLYFSLYELHPDAPGFENARKWCREPYARKDSLWWKFVKDGAIYNPASLGNDYFGAQMCLLSGWMDKLKGDIKNAYDDLGVDGIYFDYVTNSYCGNLYHHDNKHTTMDGVIEILEWTKNLVGKDGVLALHIQSSNPSIVFENYADTVITLEEIAYLETGNDDKIVYRMPELSELPAFTVEGEVVQRSICHSIVYRMNDRMVAAKRFIAMCASFGFLNYMEDYYGLKYVYDLKKYDLTGFHFKNIYSAIVDTNSSDVKGSLYYNDRKAVIFIINLSGQYLYDLDFEVNTGVLGWKDDGCYTMTKESNNISEPVFPKDSKKSYSIERIEPYEYRIYTLNRTDVEG